MEDRTAVMQRLHELREAIHLHQYQYYVENRSSLSDAEYDALYRELQALETAHPELDHPRLTDPARRWPAGRGL